MLSNRRHSPIFSNISISNPHLPVGYSYPNDPAIHRSVHVCPNNERQFGVLPP